VLEVALISPKKLPQNTGEGEHLSVFKNFGTAQVKMRDLEIEFVGARKESYKGLQKTDLWKMEHWKMTSCAGISRSMRMAICLNKDRFGELIDPFDGQKDIKRKIIKTPTDPEITFSDDPLRIMRAFRFAAQLNFDIDPVTFEAIQKNTVDSKSFS
jgi:poly(A) polymerase